MITVMKLSELLWTELFCHNIHIIIYGVPTFTGLTKFNDIPEMIYPDFSANFQVFFIILKWMPNLNQNLHI